MKSLAVINVPITQAFTNLVTKFAVCILCIVFCKIIISALILVIILIIELQMASISVLSSPTGGTRTQSELLLVGHSGSWSTTVNGCLGVRALLDRPAAAGIPLASISPTASRRANRFI